MTIARIQDVIKTFGGNTVVDRVSFDIDAGETFVLLGPSGSGKTTILRMIAGLEEPDGGRIELDGAVTNDPKSRIAPEKRGAGLGRELLRRSLLAMRSSGCGVASLTVTADNVGAIGLYERFGFEVRRRFSAFVWEPS